MNVHYTVSYLGVQMYGQSLWAVRRYSFNGFWGGSEYIAYFVDENKAKEYAEKEAFHEDSS